MDEGAGSQAEPGSGNRFAYAPASVSILIPARNEASGIASAVRTALASERVEVEVIVCDDGSEDATAAIVADLAQQDSRVRLVRLTTPDAAWCGKQRACAKLADEARHSHLLFLDADVRLQPDGAARMLQFLDASQAALVSGIPYQQTETVVERLVIPLVHFVLLGFLPLSRMRGSTHPAYAAGCGQMFLTHGEAYRAAGGHAAIRRSLHDGITLPRAYRLSGLSTDLFDGTELATCRMYRSAGEVWRGLEKNAVEGLARPGLILPMTLMLMLGQVLPLPLALATLAGWLPAATLGFLVPAVLFSYLPRALAVRRFRQSPTGAVFHPVGILILLAIQWAAWTRWMTGVPAQWKGRAYGQGTQLS